ncbi:MAG: hypothetical protein NC204_04860 [Candidatus Amulumruptor caecigallinarius]|nr:hypothetical protein [Candidatus Amulumruptor caecigallinarius]
MDSAIVEATANSDSLKFSHVGILDVSDSGEVSVIEASPRHGVVITSLDEFIKNSDNGAVVKRLDMNYPVNTVIENAKSFLGIDYDWWYLPDNDKIYCSELVEKSYVNYDGTPVFPTIPMNFRNGDDEIPAFWQELFDKLGMQVPEGVAGTNPSQISHFPKLKLVCRFKNTPNY